LYQFFFINYLLSVSIVDVVEQAWKATPVPDLETMALKKRDKPKFEGERSISQKIFIILIKLLEALSDKELNQKIDEVVMGRITTFKKMEEHTQLIQAELDGNQANHSSKISSKKVDLEGAIPHTSSATQTITKMILFNLDKLF